MLRFDKVRERNITDLNGKRYKSLVLQNGNCLPYRECAVYSEHDFINYIAYSIDGVTKYTAFTRHDDNQACIQESIDL